MPFSNQKDIDENIYPSTLLNERENYEISNLAIDTALEINAYRDRKEIISNSFSKLSKIIHNTLTPRDFLEGKRPIDEFETLDFFKQTFYHHDEEMQKQKKQTPYTINPNLKAEELKNELIPILNNLSKNIASFTTLSEENQENLEKFLLHFHSVLSHYSLPYFKKYAAA